MDTKRILVVGASSGWGHMKAAQNISAALTAATEVWEPKVIDVFDYLPASSEGVINAAWRFASKHLRPIYSKLYKRWISIPADRLLNNLVIARTARNLQTAHSLDNVVAFVATHSLAAAVGASLKRRHDFRFCVAATDFLLHSLQIHSSVDCFYVPPRFALHASESESKILRGKIVKTGIPIAADFSVRKNKYEARTKLGLVETITTALVSFGGDGLRAERHVDLCERLLEAGLPIQFIVLAGHNVRFAKAMEMRYGKSRYSDRIKVFGYHDDVIDFYSAADIFIGKAGGLSISEALSLELPIIFVDVLPGQEEFNVEVITQLGLAQHAAPEFDRAWWTRTLSEIPRGNALSPVFSASRSSLMVASHLHSLLQSS